MEEIWKEIRNYNGCYMVSNRGRVKSLKFLKTRILKQSLSDYRYLCLSLSNNNKSKQHKVHNLVAEYFVEKVVKKTQVNHIDGNRLNNNFENLEWCTQRENSIHFCSVIKGNMFTGANYSKNLNKWIAKFHHKGKTRYIGLYDSQQDAHNAYLKAIGYVK